MALNDIRLRISRPVASAQTRDRLIHLAELFTRFVLSFLLSGASILDGLSPFAAAFAAASGAGVNGIVALFGAAAGYLVFGPYLWALQYISITLMVVAFSVVFRSTEITRRTWFMPVCAGSMALIIGFVSASGDGWSLSEVLAVFADAVLCLGCTYFFKTVFQPWSGRFNFEDELIHTVSVLILISAALISLSNLMFMNTISVGRTLAALLVFITSFKGGAGIGCAAGLSVGIAMDAASGASPIFATAFGLSGLVAGIFSKQSKLLFALSFIIVDAAAAAMTFQSGAVPAILYEVFIASVVFMILPASAVSRLGAFLPAQRRGAGAMRAREYTRRRVELASIAFRELYDTTISAQEAARDADNHAVIFDRAADGACRRCADSVRCWQEEYNSTFDVMNNLTPFILKRGNITAADFPEHFSQRCLNIDGFTAAVNYELRAFLYRRQLKNRLEGNRSAAFNQYSEMSGILEGFSAELGASITLEPELENKTRKYLQSAGITADVAVFRDRGGRLHAEISGAELNAFRRDKAWLDKLSVVLGVRVCVPEGHPRSGRLELFEAEPYAATVGVSRMNKRENEVSGDTGSYFKTDEGMLYILLSDGMGAGEAASRISLDTVRILERFIRAGVAPETALRMLNDIMLLRNETDTDCATVDMIFINLFDGKTTLLKYGAAPSYIKTGGNVKRIGGASLAAGLGSPPDDEPDYATVTLREGSMIVAVSDGAITGTDDNTLVDLISAFTGEDPRELTGAIVTAARDQTHADDDVTAIAVRIYERQ